MKEATGEASMTGITIAIIAVIAAVAVPLVTGIINNTADKACCASVGGTVEGSTCKLPGSSAGVNLKGYRSNCQ